MSKYGGSLGGGGGGATLDKTLAQLDALTPAVNDLAFPNDGEAWEYRCLVAGTWSKYHRGRLTTPTELDDWPTTVNAGTPAPGFAAANSAGVVLLSATGGAGGSGRFRALPSAPYDITIDIEATLSSAAFNCICLAMRDSSNGRINEWRWCEFDLSATGAQMRTVDLSSTWAFNAPVIKTVQDGFLMSRRVRLRVR